MANKGNDSLHIKGLRAQALILLNKALPGDNDRYVNSEEGKIGWMPEGKPWIVAKVYPIEHDECLADLEITGLTMVEAHTLIKYIGAMINSRED